ncbi:Cap2p [Malassezia vespertilionis]|uniref:F-actin-capping protein subunit beta n=1 Tax=Malassezia vespertilionis TaxID=2020962 RepID=A0A2N1JA69_9BASI|nr:Cap2p [Malassezia vespertilionis]
MGDAQEDPLTLAFDILRRLPPSKITSNVEKLVNVLPEHADDLASGVDQPLVLRIDDSPQGASREYLCCDYNRDGNSWRSWITNTWNPPIEDSEEEDTPLVPTGKLRELELQANDAFETYRKLYYETGYSSVYLWDLNTSDSSVLPANFAGVVLFKKDLDTPSDPNAKGTFGTWDSIHVLEVSSITGIGAESNQLKSAKYKVSSTVMLTLNRHDGVATEKGDTVESMKVTDMPGHIINLGKLIEDIESKIRNQVQEIYFGKMHDVVDHLRSLEDLEASRNAKRLQEELVAGWER